MEWWISGAVAIAIVAVARRKPGIRIVRELVGDNSQLGAVQKWEYCG